MREGGCHRRTRYTRRESASSRTTFNCVPMQSAVARRQPNDAFCKKEIIEPFE